MPFPNFPKKVHIENKIVSIIKDHEKRVSYDNCYKIAEQIIELVKKEKFVDVEYLNPIIRVSTENEIIRLLDISRATFQRIKYDLAARGIIEKDRHGQNYRRVWKAMPYVLLKWRKEHAKEQHRQDIKESRRRHRHNGRSTG